MRYWAAAFFSLGNIYGGCGGKNSSIDLALEKETFA
jgi:hypothetical protein